MKVIRFLVVPIVLGVVVMVGGGFRSMDDSNVKHIFSKITIKRNDKAEIIAVGVAGQEATILIKTKELVDEDEFNKGTELWIKVKSEYQGKKSRSKQHRLMFGANTYQ